MTRTIDILNGVPALDELLSDVRNGDEIVVVEGDTAIARIVPVTEDSADVAGDERIGLLESEWPDTPAAREELSRRIASFEPLEMTPEEEREWAEARQAVKEYTLEAMRKPKGLPS
jgi:antitoxin (DNA-binding transcriptional repressor) of toxin-antitoxin stability system